MLIPRAGHIPESRAPSIPFAQSRSRLHTDKTLADGWGKKLQGQRVLAESAVNPME